MHKLILVVDPDQTTLNQLSPILQQQGFSALPIRDAEEAFDSIDHAHPRAIISEVDLPGMDGWEFCGRIRGHEKTHGIPFIIVSGVDDQTAKTRAFKAGADDYITKPCRPHEVSLRLTRIIERVELSEKLTLKDPLTMVNNKPYLAQRLAEECEKYRRYNRPLTLMLVDVDDFGRINETYGRLVGDRALKVVADLLASRLRSVDVICRAGADGFAVLMPETPAEGAAHAAKRLKTAKTTLQLSATALGAPAVPAAAAETIRITLSTGISTFHGQTERDAASLLDAAKNALHRAKSDNSAG